MPTEYQVDAARPADLAPALALLRAADLPETGVAEGLRDFLVLRDGERLLGLCGLELHERDGLLRSLVVDPALRGAGIGRRLVEAVLAQARRRSLRAVFLLTTTARDYFLARGFRDWPREQAPPAIRASWEFRLGCPSSSSFMRLGLEREL